MMAGMLSCDKGPNVPPVIECPNCDFDCLDPVNDEPITNDCLPNFECQFVIHENSKLDYNSSSGDIILPGNKRVFEVAYSTQGDPTIADDEFFDLLTFEIDAGLDSFEAEGDQLESLNLRYIRSCFCMEVAFKEPVSGCVQGQKINDQFWRIQFKGDFEYSFGMRTIAVDVVLEVE